MQLSERCTFVLYILSSVLLGDNVSNYVFLTVILCVKLVFYCQPSSVSGQILFVKFLAKFCYRLMR